MGGFWEAVDRAALGRPAEATPRTRSVFEMEAAPEGLDAIDVETDVPPLRETGERIAAAVAPPSPRAQSEEPVDVPREEKRGALAIAPTADDRGPDRDPPPPERVAAMDRLESVRAAVAVEARTIERLEVHRHETLHRVDASLAPPIIAARHEPAAAPATAPIFVEATPAPIASVREPQRDAPMPAEAQPMPQPSEPPRAVVPQAAGPQPLVIEIDRIEIRIEPERAAPATGARAKEPAAPVSLEDYLARQAARGG